jgi:hypothetical protein
LFGRIFYGKPVSTSPENALARRRKTPRGVIARRPKADEAIQQKMADSRRFLDRFGHFAAS